MQGVNQLPVWQGQANAARDHAGGEPPQPHVGTPAYAGHRRYKITVYRSAAYGELFDLEADPDERQNRWSDPSYADIKSDLLLKFVQSEIARESTHALASPGRRDWGLGTGNQFTNVSPNHLIISSSHHLIIEVLHARNHHPPPPILFRGQRTHADRGGSALSASVFRFDSGKAPASAQ
ncbi:MAG: hypothetical protein R2856_28450 [Caldilineaceae bacterium]